MVVSDGPLASETLGVPFKMRVSGSYPRSTEIESVDMGE